MDSASPEFVKAWQLYFRQRGGVGPQLPPEVLPVVVLDNNAQGPYPPYRPWHASIALAAGAGVRQKAGIQNLDGVPVGGGVMGTTPIRSMVVIDYLIYRCESAADVFLTFTDPNQQPLSKAGTVKAVDDDSPGVDAFNVQRPRVGNVIIGGREDALQSGDSGPSSDDVGDVSPKRIDGPFLIGPQQIFLVEINAVAVGLRCFFKGRYYGGA